MTLYEQAIGSITTLCFVSGFIWALILLSRAGRGTGVVVVALSWVVAIVLYRVIFFALPEDSGFGYVAFMGLTFVFVFAFWGLIDLAIHSKARLKGGEAARFAQGAGLLALSAALFVAAYFVPDALASLIPGAGFGVYFLGILGAALAAILCFRAGARAVYANPAAVPGLLAARKATAEVMPDKVAYMLGETVHAADRISGRRDFEVSDARAELFYTSRHSYLTFDPRGGSLLVDETDRVVVDTERLQTEGTIRKGGTSEHGVSLRLPTDAPPTGEGEITGVAWTIGVVLSVPGGPDVVNKASITVLSTRDTYGERSGREPEPGTLANTEIKLRLAGCDLRPGERVEGRLVVTPREAFEAREVRVELVRRELVLRDDGNHHETVEAREVVAGRVRLHPRTSQGQAFGVLVPRNLSCPASETARTYAGWFLRCVIDRGTHPDHAVERELNVFGEPRKDQST